MRPSLLALLILMSVASVAQERLSPLTNDPAKALDTRKRLQRSEASPNMVRSVSLPFIDDFSQDHLFGNAPGNTVLWEELEVSRHTSFAIDPPSIGVAVFDGLNDVGAPYVTNSAVANGRADQLTSMDINLSGEANVVLSFYYQPAGRGDSPEGNDSLILQFFDPSTSIWSMVWHATGTPVTPFIPVRLSVGDDYLENGFRLRFINYGRLTGALDQWALDWVYLDANRDVNDESLNDVGFALPVNSLLNADRAAIPWKHFIDGNPGSLMLTQKEVLLRNNRNANALITESGYNVYYEGLLEAGFIDPQAPSMLAMSDLGIVQEIASDNNNFVYPTGVSDTEASFDVEFHFSTNPDLSSDNNLLRFTQKFGDYYAYDDGQADIAYGIINFTASGKVALEYQVLQTDTLAAIDMQFLYQAAQGTDLEDQLFYLTIWEKNASDVPGDILYQDLQARYVTFDPDGGFVRYFLQDTLILEANEQYFFGWQQPDNISLNIGNDLSTDLNTTKLYYNVGSGWTASSYPGVIMLRPAFPNFVLDNPVGIDEMASLNEVSVWPIPADDHVMIQGQFPIGSIATLYDLNGRVVTYEPLVSEINRLDLSFTSEGLYFLELSTGYGTRRIEKIVVNR